MILREPAHPLDPRVRTYWLVQGLIGAGVLAAFVIAGTVIAALVDASPAAWLIGALGGVAVNLAFRQSFLSRGTADAAYVAFVAYYVLCLAVTWLVYLRPSARRVSGV